MQLIAVSQGPVLPGKSGCLLTKKIWLIMKMTIVLLTIACLQLAAKGSAQSVTLSVKNAPLEKVFKELKKQTGYDFWYESKLLHKAKRVYLDVKNIPLKQALGECFKDQPFAYTIVDKIIVVKLKPQAEFPAIMPTAITEEPPLLIDISGTVTDDKGQPLAGATVLVKGTNVGTKTDANGSFSVNAEPASTLIISYVGFESTEVKIGNRTNITVRLQPSLSVSDEVVVIGYGTAKKSDLTGSISHLDAETFQNQSMTQLTSMLAGTTPGVQITQGASAAGGGSILIRGTKSLSGGTDPLIVLDEVIYDGSLKDINPNDIESIDVMKDASSAAVYGASAAGGVILVTTKKGKIGKPVINFSSKIGVATTTHDLKPFGPKGYLDLHRDFQTQVAGIGGSSQYPFGYFYSPDDLPDGITLEEWRSWSNNSGLDDIDVWTQRIGLFPTEMENYKAGKTTNFYDFVIGTAVHQDYSIGVGGGSKDVKYYLSAGYLNNKGIIKGDEFKAIRMRLNLDLKVTDWLHVGTNSQFGSRDESVVQGNLGLAMVQSPYGSMWNLDGTLNKYPSDYTLSRNPLENYYNQDRLKRINSVFSNLYINVQFPFGFKYKLSFQPSLNFSNDYNYWGPGTTTGGDSHVGGYASRDDGKEYGWRLDNILTWNKTFGVNRFDVTLLTSSEVHKGWNSHQDNSTFSPSGNLGYNALQFGNNPSLSDNDNWASGNSFMGRINYTLLNKYLITTSVRRDGYSAFGQKNPQATFPAVALAWIISNESFFKVPYVNFMKLRLSQGMNGNRNIGAYSALARLGSVLDYDGSNVRTGVYNSTLANANLKWEKTVSTGIGLDMELFQGRVSLSIDAYKSKTTDLLMNRKLPIITGFNSITTNLGELDNKGLNVLINTVNVENNNFGWKSSIVFSMNRNKIVKLFGDSGTYKILGKTNTGELPDFSNGWFPGQANDVVWNYNVAGVWQVGDKADAAIYGLVPGDHKVEDVNNDGKLLQFDDKKFIGHTLPQFSIGLRNEFSILKNLNASIFLRADLGYTRSLPLVTSDKSGTGRQNIWSWPYWSFDNPTNDWGRYVFPDNFGKYEGGLTIYKPTGFLRVQEISLSYNLPQVIIQRAKLQGLRIFGSINNFLTVSKWPGFDPESGMTPMPKTFTLGVNLSL